jgi:transposase-like protein
MSKETTMLSDSPHRKDVPSKPKRTKDVTTNRQWSDSQKLEAVTTYLALGNLALSSRVLGIPEMTLREWKNKEWWKEVEGELKVQDDIQLSSRLKRIIESTITATEDRLANGDWIFNSQSGTLMRKPVPLRDVHRVTMDMLDKRESIANKQPVSANLEQIDEKLKRLAEKFDEIAQGRRPIEVTDVITGELIESTATATA